MYYPVLAHIGRINIYTHGVMIALGAIIGGAILYLIAKKNGFRSEMVFDLIVYSLFGGIIGSRILYVILYYHQFSSIKDTLSIWNGGLVSFGGMIGGLLVAYFYLKAKREDVLKWFDIGIIGLLIGWAFGRIGCLLNGDSVGIISIAKIAVWGRIPTQLFETIWVILAATGCYILLKFKDKWQLKNGTIFISGIGLYVLGRFVIDFFRDEPDFVWFLKAGQFGSLIILLLSIIVILIMLKTERESNGSV